MHDERKLRGKASKSFARRIIKVWIFGVLVPLLVVESLILWQFTESTTMMWMKK